MSGRSRKPKFRRCEPTGGLDGDLERPLFVCSSTFNVCFCSGAGDEVGEVVRGLCMVGHGTGMMIATLLTHHSPEARELFGVARLGAVNVGHWPRRCTGQTLTSNMRYITRVTALGRRRVLTILHVGSRQLRKTTLIWRVEIENVNTRLYVLLYVQWLEWLGPHILDPRGRHRQACESSVTRKSSPIAKRFSTRPKPLLDRVIALTYLQT